jgi:hypothetical protein
MQDNTPCSSCQPEAAEGDAALWASWEDLVAQLGALVDLEESARQAGALTRRRKVRSAQDLLRATLAYALGDAPLRQLAVWWLGWELPPLSDVALRSRLRGSVRWLGQLIVAVLAARGLHLPKRPGLRLRIQDATTISRPGSRGTDWRLHLSLDAGAGWLDGVELTDAHGGESLVRFAPQPGEIRLADAGHAHARGLGALLAEGGQVVVRTNWQNLPLETAEGQRLDLAGWLRTLEGRPEGVWEREVWLPTPQGRFRVRLVVGRVPSDKAEAARRRARQAARKKKHQVDPRTLVAAGFVLLVSNLSGAEWSAGEVLALYRLRWQVEMLIKRLKGVLGLDGLRARDPQMAQSYLLAKVLGALLVEDLLAVVRDTARAVWGEIPRLLSPWRLLALGHDLLQAAVRGIITAPRQVGRLSELRRGLVDPPRKRGSQYAAAQALVQARSAAVGGM